MKIEIELSDADVLNLRVLGAGAGLGADETAVIRYLLTAIADGVRRPGSWEREWLRCAFDDSWERGLEAVPESKYGEQRPRDPALQAAIDRSAFGQSLDPKLGGSS